MSRITVATINLRNRSDRWKERRQVLLNELMETLPDLIALQEVSFPIAQGRWLRNQLNSRLEVTGRGGYQLVQRRKAHLVHGYLEGIGILSRLPVAASDSVSLGHGGRVALRVAVEIPRGRLLDFVSTHLHHVAHDHEVRLEQTMRMVGWLKEIGSSRYQVIAGDFNELPDGPAIEHMKQYYASAFVEVHHYEPLATFPTALVPPGNGWAGCIDYIFVSSAVEVRSARIFCNRPAPDDPTLYPSDHVGLLAEVEVGD